MSSETSAVPPLEQLCISYYDAVYRHVCYYVGDDEVAADLTQETFYKVIRAYARLTYGTYIYSWLCRIATNTVHDYRDGATRHVHLDLEAIEDVPDSTHTDPYEMCDIGELDPGPLRSAWLTLSPRNMRLIGLLMEGYAPGEIASILGWESKVTYGAIREARLSFKRRYRGYQEGVGA